MIYFNVWRFTTVDCVRVWKLYAVAGPAEVVRRTIPECVRAAAVGLPLLAVGPAAPVVGHPGASWGGLGPNAWDIAPYSAPTQNTPGYGSAQNTAAVGGSYPVSAVPPPGLSAAVSGGHVAPAPQTAVGSDLPLAGGGSPPLSFEHQPPRAPGPSLPEVVAPDVVPVSEPSALACMAAALLTLTCLRNRKAAGRDRHPSQPRTSTHGVTHA